MTDQKLPLSGLHVADFGWFAATPICTEVMGIYGAEVVRVESESHLDGLRALLPFPLDKTGYNVGGWFNNYNANKLGVTLNLNTAKGIELAYKLVRWADVFVSNFTPRIIERWGLTYDKLCEVKPDIIAAYEPMQGFEGPHRDFLGFGAVLCPITGFNHLCGFPEREPLGLGTNYPDYVINPIHTLTAILSALRYRRKTGKGQRIELAQFDSSVCALGPSLMDYIANGRVQNRAGNRLPHASPHGAFPCHPLEGAGYEGEDEERWCVIAVFTDDQWRALCKAMGDPPWSQDPKFATLLGRKQHEDELEQRIAEWTASRRPEDVMHALQAAGVPAGVVQNGRDILESDAHLQERGYYVYLDHPEAGRTAYDGSGFRLTKTPGVLHSPACCLGEHNEKVCKEILGLDADEIADLMVEQVLY